MAVTFTQSKGQVQPKTRFQRLTWTFDANGSTSGSTDSTTDFTGIIGLLWGVWWNPATATAGADFDILHNGVDLLQGDGDDVGNTDEFIPGVVTVGGTKFPYPVPVNGDLRLSLAQIGASDTGTVEVWILKR